ncbi:MAG: tyrosine-type recombinase/integrase, partial [Solirubrobacterales bacterium]|nr:tyrosine-type recombinase/integrase [Solirubrobacterales bacterium]
NETVGRFISEKGNQNPSSRSFLRNLKAYLLRNHKELNINSEALENILEIELPSITGHKKYRLVKPLTREEVLELEKIFTDEKDKIMILITFFCGLRLGELLKIKVISFDWEAWKKDVSKMGECRVFGKGDKEGIALVPPELMVRIARYIRENNKLRSPESFLFIDKLPDNITYLANKALSWRKKLKEAGVTAGITKKGNEGSLIEETIVRPHRLRHSWATYLLNEKGLNMREVQEILRHSSITSTEIYTHIDKEKLKERLMKK